MSESGGALRRLTQRRYGMRARGVDRTNRSSERVASRAARICGPVFLIWLAIIPLGLGLLWPTIGCTSDSTPQAGPTERRSTFAPVPVDLDFAAVADSLRPTVVSVVSTFETPLTRASHSAQVSAPESPHETPGRSRVRRGVGSGIILDDRGHLLTNEHVVASAMRVHVELADATRIGASVIHGDPTVDLAILKLDRVPELLRPARFSVAPPRPGAWVMGIGHPFGLGHTVTVGVISGLARDYDDLGRPKGLHPDGTWSFIQTDASINIGNSGGPLVDAFGNVVGIVTAVRIDGSGIAFAIPTDLALRYVEEVHNHGRLRHPRLGLVVRELPSRLEKTTWNPTLVVDSTLDAGPARIAGVRAGDEIIACGVGPAAPAQPTPRIARISQLQYCAQIAGVAGLMTLELRRASTSEAGWSTQLVSVVPDELR